MDKTDKLLKQFGKSEVATVVPIGSDVIIPNHSGIKGNQDAMNKLTFDTVTDNGNVTTNSIMIGSGASGSPSRPLHIKTASAPSFQLEDVGTSKSWHFENYNSNFRVVETGVGLRFNVAAGGYIGNDDSVSAKAVMTLNSTSKGFLPPRMTTAQKNAITSVPVGLIVFDTDLNKLCVMGAAAWETITSA